MNQVIILDALFTFCQARFFLLLWSFLAVASGVTLAACVELPGCGVSLLRGTGLKWLCTRLISLQQVDSPQTGDRTRILKKACGFSTTGLPGKSLFSVFC